jgi:predicted nucleotidyltransferase
MFTYNDLQLKQRIGIPDAEISQFCQKWHIIKMGIFGSILSPQYRPDSDIDILIQFNPAARQGLLTIAKIKLELENKLHRAIDIAIWEGVENSDNWIRRKSILDTVTIIYEQK